MTLHEKAVLSAYTGIAMCEFSHIHEYIEKILGRPVLTHEMSDEAFWDEVKEKSEKDFMEIVTPESDENTKFNQYLSELNDLAHHVTHENFVKIQQFQSDVQNDYTSGALSWKEKGALYTASVIIMDEMRKQLHPIQNYGKELNSGNEKNQDGPV